MAESHYSSFQIAKMLNVSRQAVNQWIDKGFIESYRTPGGHRRVAQTSLIQFLNQRQIPVPDALRSTSTQPGVTVSRTEPIRLFMLDDDEDFLQLLGQAIHELLPEVRITSFSNGFDALIAIGAQVPDLLVIDLKMPTMDGIEVCRRLRQNSHTVQVPILVVTAFDADPEIDQVQRLKVDRVLSKSTNPLLELATQIAAFARSLNSHSRH